MKFKLLLFLIVLLQRCQNNENLPDQNLIQGFSELESDYSIIKYGNNPVLLVNGKISFNQSLKEIYAGNYSYTRIECDPILNFIPSGRLKIEQEEAKSKKISVPYSLSFCEKNHASKQQCTNDLEVLSNYLTQDLKCEASFGGMAQKSKIITSQIVINYKWFLASKPYKVN